MDAESRRARIREELARRNAPVSASTLAQALEVSRQVVVGDVALLRAQGHDIIATARGYVIPRREDALRYMGTVACRHAPEDTRAELYVMVDMGAVVRNVTVEHEVYGEITGNLSLSTREDVDDFIGRVEGAQVKLLSELTHGIHLHAIACRDRAMYERVLEGLSGHGFLYRE